MRVGLSCFSVSDDGVSEEEEFVFNGGFEVIDLVNELQCLFIDSLQVIQNRGPLLEETHYYPFGLTMAGISSKAAGKLENRVKFNGYEQQSKEFSDGSGLEWYDYKHRYYDDQLGRFFSVDGLADKYPYYSTYQFAGNEVPNAIDQDGLEPAYAINGSGFSSYTVPAGDNLKRPIPASRQQDFTNTVGKPSPNDSKQAMIGMAGIAVAATSPLLFEAAASAWVTFAPEISAMMGVEANAAAYGVARGTAGVAGMVASETAGGEAAGVNLTIRGKANWSSSQNADADAYAKAEALTAAETVTTTKPVARESGIRNKFIKAGNAVGPNQQVDHTVDLQLGGTNAMSNLKAIDGSVNMSFGKQINNQIKNLPDATRVNKVIFMPHKP